MPGPPDISPATRYCRAGLILFCLLLWLPGFFSLPPGDRDESRFAQASKQMIETGGYVRIMNGTEPRNRKPIGIYWLQVPFALAAGPGLGNPIWPYRIPSLLGGLAAVLAVFQTGLLIGMGRRASVLASAMLAASVILTTEVHIAKTDAALLGATTIAMGVLARAWLGRSVARWQAAGFWLAAGAGILLKGPITPMVVGLAALCLCVWEGRGRWLLALRPAWGAPLMLAAILPWFIAIGVATHGQFFADAVGGDLGRKLAGGSEAHGGFPGLHLLLLPLLAFPSTVAVLCGLAAAWRNRRDSATRFLIAWVAPAWLVFEAVPTKLPHYTLPLYPALFLLGAHTLAAPRPALPRGIVTTGRVAVALAGIVLCAAAVALPVMLHATWWLGVPAAALAAVATGLAVRGAVAPALVMAIPLYAAILQLELPNLSALWIAPQVEAALRANWPAWNPRGDGLGVAGYAEPSLRFLAGTDLRLLPNGAEAAGALAQGTLSLVLVTDRELAPFDAAAEKLGLHTRQVGQVAGFNYSRGRFVTLTLMVRAP